MQCPNRHFYSDHLRACPDCHAGHVTCRGSAQSTTASYPAGSKAQSGRKTTDRKRPDKDSLRFRACSATSLCFFRLSKRPAALPHPIPSSHRYPFQADLFQPVIGKYGEWDSQAGWRNLLRKFILAGKVQPPTGGPHDQCFIQAGTTCLEHIQILAIPIAANRYQYGNQAQKVKAAWSAWKYWQAGPVQGSGPHQPPAGGAGKGQTSPPNSGAAQTSGTD